MNTIFRCAASLILIMLLVLPQPVYSQSAGDWQPVGTGIDYQEFHPDTPNNIYVARLDRNNASAIIDSSLANGKLSGGTEQVRYQALRYDQAINYWGSKWGARNQVVVAINGFYYSGAAATPKGGIIQNGWYAKRFDNLYGFSGMAWKLDRSAFIGECVNNPEDLQYITKPGSDYSQAVDGINAARGETQLVLYTPQFGGTTRTGDDGVEVVVEMSRPAMLISTPRVSTGTVTAVRDGMGNTAIPFDGVVLSGSGQVATDLAGTFHIGDTVGVALDIKSYDSDCGTTADLDWSKTYASVGGDPVILSNGSVVDAAVNRDKTLQPRTALALNDQYVYFIVVDGRSQKSLGMTYRQLASFAQSLGATWAIAQDGGGSSTMVVNGQVKNQPSSACRRQYFPLIVQETSALQSSEEPAPAAEAPDLNINQCVRAVANGLMMINVLPEERSDLFSVSSAVVTRSDTAVRQGPGSNYPLLDTLPAGTNGMVEPHANNLNGIAAKGEFWWLVNFNNVEGWVSESALNFRGAPPFELSDDD